MRSGKKVEGCDTWGSLRLNDPGVVPEGIYENAKKDGDALRAAHKVGVCGYRTANTPSPRCNAAAMRCQGPC